MRGFSRGKDRRGKQMEDAFAMPPLVVGDLRVDLPIVQGGMSVGISLSGLASAVAREGGVGVIGTAGIGMLEPDGYQRPREANLRALRKEIRRAKELSGGRGAIGTNILVALSDFEDLLRVSVEEGADMVFMGAGLPMKVPSMFGEGFAAVRTKFVPIVSSGRAAALIFKSWAKSHGVIPDAVVVEGPMAGGHLGFSREELKAPPKLEDLVLQVIEAVKPFEDLFGRKVPVIAAGGIYTGEDIYRFLKLGASAVQMATRFVATHECDADLRFKEEYLRSREEDVVIIDSPVGLPGRAIRNAFLEAVERGEKKPFSCPWKCLRTCDHQKAPYCIAMALTSAKLGKLEMGFAFAGQNCFRVDRIVSVKELIDELREGYRRAAMADQPLSELTR